MAANPFGGDVIKLEGIANRWRRRWGNYRIFLTVNFLQKQIVVNGISRRTSTTY